jgi:hypothetical protein
MCLNNGPVSEEATRLPDRVGDVPDKLLSPYEDGGVMGDWRGQSFEFIAPDDKRLPRATGSFVRSNALVIISVNVFSLVRGDIIGGVGFLSPSKDPFSEEDWSRGDDLQFDSNAGGKFLVLMFPGRLYFETPFLGELIFVVVILSWVWGENRGIDCEQPFQP